MFEHGNSPRGRDLTDSSVIQKKLDGLYGWLNQTGNNDIVERIITGSGKEIATLFSTASDDELTNYSTYTKQINMGSYNYSGLATNKKVIEANQKALEDYGTGLSGARLLNGTSDLHIKFEKKLANFIGMEDAITYSSGLVANFAVISSFCCEGDVVFSDALNHNSIVEGLKLTKAQIIKYPHSDMAFLESELEKLPFEKRKFIITDSVFSMDGDIAQIEKIVALSEKHNCFVILDEAHGVGACGPNLRGMAAKMDLISKIDLITGSLSKGLPGGVGGFVCGNKQAIDAMRFCSSGYVFSGSLAPNILAGLIKGLEILQEDKSIEKKIMDNQAYLRQKLIELGFHVPAGETPIVPVIFENRNIMFTFCRELHQRGIFVNPVAFPFVSKDSPRIRLNATANITKDDLDNLISEFVTVATKLDLNLKKQNS